VCETLSCFRAPLQLLGVCFCVGIDTLHIPLTESSDES
jgi:hypothetical protein